MEALFKIKASEFNEALFDKIRSLVKGTNTEITIAIGEATSLSILNESPTEYISRIKQVADNIESGKGISFTMEELKSFMGK